MSGPLTNAERQARWRGRARRVNAWVRGLPDKCAKMEAMAEEAVRLAESRGDAEALARWADIQESMVEIGGQARQVFSAEPAQ